MVRVFSQYISSKSIALAVFECIIITLALILTTRFRHPNEANPYTAVEFAMQALICVVVLQICLYYSDFYDVRAVKRTDEQIICLGQSIGAACVVFATFYYLFPTLLMSRGLFLTSMSVVGGAIIVSRLALDAAWRIAAPLQNVAIFGPGELGVRVAEEILSRDDLNLRVTGIVTAGDKQNRDIYIIGNREIPVLGDADQLESIVNEYGIHRIVVATDTSSGAPVRDLIRLRVQGLRVDNVHTTMAGLTGRIWLDAVPSSWFLFASGFDRSRTTLAAKRAFDLFFGTLGLFLSAPIMCAVALAVRLDSKGPALYRQVRVGYKGKPFELLKFRSMRTDAEAAGARWAQEDDPRVTRLGKFLRKYRFDELPQFFNVVRGEMSFVGPRPERPVFVEQLRQVIPFYDERHMVRPGLTGWAQVEYQYGSTIAHACRKLEYDLFYLMNLSILFDLVIAMKTVRTLISGRGSC